VSFEQSFERGDILSISHFLRQVVPEDCGFTVVSELAVTMFICLYFQAF